ncbi:MAG: hypothetical protein K0Q56_826 [Sporolactobacillus laevolacticus]|jgi:hypothetical protein|nr:hypothetical protein [Sporolactobacillus laevolacticus]
MNSDLSVAVQRLSVQTGSVEDMVRGLNYLVEHHQPSAKLSDVFLQWIAQQIATLQTASDAGSKGAKQTLAQYRDLEAALYAAQQASAQQYANTL